MTPNPVNPFARPEKRGRMRIKVQLQYWRNTTSRANGNDIARIHDTLVFQFKLVSLNLTFFPSIYLTTLHFFSVNAISRTTTSIHINGPLKSQDNIGKMINKSHVLTYLYLLIYILLSSGVILYNKYFNFPFPITLTMVHMGFSGVVAFFLVRVLKVVTPIKMTFEIYATCVIPISAFFASSLWFGNTAYLHILVAFIQMLKALMPVATFLMAVLCGTDTLRCDVFLNMLLVSVGVVVSSYGEIHFNIIGTLYQVTGIVAEALRLVLTQVLLRKKGLTLNPIISLYYIAPCRYKFQALSKLNSLTVADLFQSNFIHVTEACQMILLYSLSDLYCYSVRWFKSLVFC